MGMNAIDEILCARYTPIYEILTVTLNNASDNRTNGVYWTPNPNPFVC